MNNIGFKVACYIDTAIMIANYYRGEMEATIFCGFLAIITAILSLEKK
ncbi:hypothetical protein [Romboutsia sp.]|nr:hypothetical protein [Romboutsia sp.]HSQ90201.1 hypothetical protein [Romboutsia sp.]